MGHLSTLVVASIGLWSCSRAASSRQEDTPPSKQDGGASTGVMTGRSTSSVSWVTSTATASAATRATPSPSPAERDAGVDAPPPALFDPSLPIDAALRRVCHGRTHCRLLSRASAGHDGQGRALEVIGIDLSVLDDAGKPVFVEDGGALLEQWSVAYAATPGTPPEVHTLSTQGWAPFGFPGADALTVTENRVVIEAMTLGAVGAAMQWTHVVRLSPPSLRGESESYSGRTQPFAGRSRWSWDDFQGDASWFTDRCVPDGGAGPADWDWLSDGPDGGPPSSGEAYLLIPRVTLDSATFGEDAWQTTDLGRCSALVDGSGSHGFLVKGAASKTSTASMRVLAIEADDFLIELRDGGWARRGDAMLVPRNQGQLEVWAAREAPEACPHDAPSVAWTVRVTDGVVGAGFGHPNASALAVTRVIDGDRVRMKLHLTAPHASVAFAYREGGDASRPTRVFATSRVRPGDAASLGIVKVIDPKDATCRASRDGDAGSNARVLVPIDTVGLSKPLEN